jgi:hypothetical protein
LAVVIIPSLALHRLIGCFFPMSILVPLGCVKFIAQQIVAVIDIILVITLSVFEACIWSPGLNCTNLFTTIWGYKLGG